MKPVHCFLFAMAALSISAHRGLAAHPVVVADTSPPHHPQQPQLAIDAKGVIHVAFGSNDDVQYARSDDGGESYSKPVKLDTVRVLSLGMRRGPRVAVSGDAVCISVIGGKQGKGKDGDVLLYRSEGKGATWEEPVIVNDEPDSAREGLHAMAASIKGELTCVWLDLRNKKSEVYASTSTDGGKTWSKNVLAYRSPSGSVCECCHPSVAYAPDGTLHVMWRNSVSGKRDMYHAVSKDGGKSYSKAEKLGMGSWPLDHCPMDGGSLAILSDGKVATAWRRDKTVYFNAGGSAKEVELGPGEQPWVAATSTGPVAVWLRKRGDALMLRQAGTKAVELAKSAGDPVIAAGGPKNDVVVAAWEESHGGARKIVSQRIELRH